MRNFSSALFDKLYRLRNLLTSRRLPSTAPQSRRRFRPGILLLEDRLTPSTFTVTNNSDTGVANDGSLRGEIAAASAGDTVNFASRLESLNKEFNSQLLISSAVCDALGDAGRDAVSLGQVAIKGYDRPMAVWQLG